MWEPQLAIAARGWRVVAPQLRGMDDGGGDPPAESIDDYAGDVVDLLDALHLHDAVIGGLSLGGYVALAMLRWAPQYFGGLVLADTRPQADSPEGLEGRQRMLKLLSERGTGAVVEEMVPRLLSEATLRQRPDLVERVRALALASRPEAVAWAIGAMMGRQDSTALLSSIHCPTLVMVGRDDALTPPSVAREMHDAIVGSELAVIDGAGHLPNLEQPQAFNDALARFLDHRL
jgi:3-oxoadipate enol-lactonase